MRIYKGHTLVEMMLALSLFAFLLFAIGQFFTQQFSQQHRLLDQLALQQQIDDVLHMMAKDLKRTGFRAFKENIAQTNYAFFMQNGQAFSLGQKEKEAKESCVIFFYDLDHNGCLGGMSENESKKADAERHCIKDGRNNVHNLALELFGYRLAKNNVEKWPSKKKEIKDYCPKALCQTYTSSDMCNTARWDKLFDEKQIQILDLRFKLLKNKNKKAIEIYLKGKLKAKKYHKNPVIYETSAIVPLMNQ